MSQAGPSGHGGDILVQNVRVVDVERLQVFPGWFSVEGGLVAQVGEAGDGLAPAGILAAARAAGAEMIDGGGRFAVPGLLDVHTHIESSFVTPRRFAEAVLPAGTTTVVADPHEIANVLGYEGVRYMLDASRDLPLRIFFSVPSCVPATSAELETSGAEWGPAEIRRVYESDDRFIALGEMMDYRAVVDGEARAVAILAEAKERGWLVEGHCPTLAGAERAAYFAAGIRTDHTLMTPEKIRAELDLGVWVEIQEKSIQPETVAVLTGGVSLDKVLFVTDDFPPNGFAQGHLVCNLRKAIELGLSPLEALASATIRPARLMGLARAGALQPGRWADFFLTSDLAKLPVEQVFVAGREYQRTRRTERAEHKTGRGPGPTGRVSITHLSERDFAFSDRTGKARCSVIRTNGENTLTSLETREVDFVAGHPVVEGTDLALVAVFERHGRSGAKAFGFLAGYGHLCGAVASTVAHDSHNLVIIGTNPADMATAANYLGALGGGFVAVRGGRVYASVPLPIAGLLSDEPVDVICRQVDEFEAALRECGVTHQRGLMFLTMLTLTTSPHVKLSDQGLVDIDARRLIPVVEGDLGHE